MRKQEADQHVTERGVEREREDDAFIPVIVKRTDEARRHPDDILEHAVEEGIEQIERKALSLFLSAVAAGLILSFSVMAVGVVATLYNGELSLSTRVMMAFVYPLGFVICVMSGTQLFTEHTATAVYPVLDRKKGVRDLFRLWLIVIVGNLCGAFISAGMLFAADDVIHASQGYVAIGDHLIEFDTTSLIMSSILAGWLMALGGWLSLATPPTISQMFSIYIVTFLIGIGGLHHSIAGSVEIFTAYFLNSEISLQQVFSFLSKALLGNAIGGSVFVAVLNYGHIRETQPVNDDSNSDE